MKAIFDKSAFHGERFEHLVNSPLLKLSRQRRISVYHTPLFIEETIRMYLKEKNRETLRQQLPFIFDICQERWLRERIEIWVKELVEDTGKRGSIFMPDEDRRVTEANIKKLVFENNFDQAAFDRAIMQIDENKLKAGKIKQSAIKLREDMSAQLKSFQKSRKDIRETSNEFVAFYLDDFGVEIIKQHLPVSNCLTVSEKWKKQKNNYPYFTLFVRGFLYSGYYAMAYPNEPIDDNALADVSQLCYLQGVDVIVSNDEKFMRKAFDFMYAGQSKQIMTTEEFVEHLTKM